MKNFRFHKIRFSYFSLLTFLSLIGLTSGFIIKWQINKNKKKFFFVFSEDATIFLGKQKIGETNKPIYHEIILPVLVEEFKIPAAEANSFTIMVAGTENGRFPKLFLQGWDIPDAIKIIFKNGENKNLLLGCNHSYFKENTNTIFFEMCIWKQSMEEIPFKMGIR